MTLTDGGDHGVLSREGLGAPLRSRRPPCRRKRDNDGAPCEKPGIFKVFDSRLILWGEQIPGVTV
jgi:hypothetical protein